MFSAGVGEVIVISGRGEVIFISGEGGEIFNSGGRGVLSIIIGLKLALSLRTCRKDLIS